MKSNNKPTGHFDFLLGIDCETTGLTFNNPDPSINHQAVSWGLIVIDANTLNPIEDLYVEIKWNEQSKQQRKENSSFGKKAESIHGLTYDYLEQNGITEEQAVAQIGNLILKYWNPNSCIKALGQNVHMFDIPFLRSLFNKHDINLKFGTRHIDTNSIGFAVFETYNSDDLFNTVGFDLRKEHNALRDAYMALKVVKTTRVLFNSFLETDND